MGLRLSFELLVSLFLKNTTFIQSLSNILNYRSYISCLPSFTYFSSWPFIWAAYFRISFTKKIQLLCPSEWNIFKQSLATSVVYLRSTKVRFQKSSVPGHSGAASERNGRDVLERAASSRSETVGIYGESRHFRGICFLSPPPQHTVHDRSHWH